MIHIDRKHLPVPEVIRTEEFQKLIGRLLKEKSEHDFDSHQKYIKKLSKDLKPLYHYKCGYCETPVNPESAINADHYRPKRKLKDDKSHPGYYWLGYDWNNLVPVCPDCNRAKLTHFPIDTAKGKRVFDPSSLRSGCISFKKAHADEYPLLLHPEMDIPEEHLTFLPDGHVKGISPKGDVTIEICKLSRSELVDARKGLVDRFFEGFATPLRQYITKDISQETLEYVLDKEFTKMKRARERRRPYSRLGWFLFEDFENFIIQKFEEGGLHRPARLLEKAYSMYLKHGTCRKIHQTQKMNAGKGLTGNK